VTIVFHDGDDGGTSTFLGFVPEEQIGVVLLVGGSSHPGKMLAGLNVLSLLLARDVPPIAGDLLLDKAVSWVATG
jgi:hypothetical protein